MGKDEETEAGAEVRCQMSEVVKTATMNP